MKRILAVLLLGMLPLFAFAETAVPPLTGRVNDLAGTIAPHLRSPIEARLADFEKETSNQVVILTIPTFEGDDLSSFSQRAFESWKLGQKGKDNGVLILVVKDRLDKGQKKSVRIHVGRGLEGSLPDAICKRIIVDFMKPLMKEGKYEAGFNAGIDQIIAATKGEFTSEVTAAGAPEADGEESSVPLLLILALVGYLIASVVWPLLGGGVAAGSTYLMFASTLAGAMLALSVVAAFLIGWLLAHGIRNVFQSGGFSDYSSSDSGSWSFGSSGGSGGGFSGGGGDSAGGGADD